jgi:predicted nucleotidyltransferase
MDVARPYSAVVPTIDGDVLFVLATTSRPLTGRQIAAEAHRGSPTAVAAVLDRLVDQGLVLRQQAGRANLHTLNRDHLAAGAVESLAGLRTELFRRLREELASWEMQPLSAVLFGSTARGDGDTESDVDMLVVRPDGIDADFDRWRDQLADLADRVGVWTGNHAAIVELSEAALPHLQRSDPPIVASLRQDGVDLAGRPVRKLFSAQT